MRFSIRDLMWATVVVAMGIGSLVNTWRLRAERDHYKQAAETNLGYYNLLWETYKSVHESETSP